MTSNDVNENGRVGTLYVVATPIGHLADWSERARTVLQTVAVIAAEDTRHSQRLLTAYGIQRPLVALHDHNERTATPALLAQLQAGESVALISDAGTPLISDPGFYLVRMALAAGLRVSPIPGASSVIAALSVSGLSAVRFAFEGFLPSKTAARRRQLESLIHEPRTLIFLEAPHRIADTLADCVACFGAARAATVCRELTKTFEEIRHSDLATLACEFADSARQRGEFVLLVDGAPPVDAELDAETDRILGLLLTALPLKQAVNLAADITHKPRNGLYARALQQKPALPSADNEG